MSLEVVRGFSVPKLLHVLNEKLGLKDSGAQGIPLPLGVSVGSLKPKVRTHRFVGHGYEI